jgi:alpha-1,3(6)-mannosylglycoprotein beta-1,6-N-acetyl-glucosaminyltransferase
VLAEEKSLHFAQTANTGGPLGELVQWCDLITSLYILGHDIQVTVEHQEMLRYILRTRSSLLLQGNHAGLRAV